MNRRGQGQFSSALLTEKRPCPSYALRSEHPHPTPGLSSSSATPIPPPLDQRHSGGQQSNCEDTWLSTGGEISFTRASVIWTLTNEAIFLTSTDEQPQAGLGSVAPLLMIPTVAVTPKLLPWQISNEGLITCRFSGSFCLLIKHRFVQPPTANRCWLFRNIGFPWPDASLASTQSREMNGPKRADKTLTQTVGPMGTAARIKR